MNTRFFIVLGTVLFLGCKQTGENADAKSEAIVYDMYEPSEMATLMNAMYEHNQKVKQAILAGETPSQFPEDFLKIHTAELSDFKDRDEHFEQFSKQFIQAQKEVFNPEADTDVKTRYNQAVNLCIACHQTACTGPIPRIKKLLIP
ncbi:MAG TPA: hypothetical protein VFF15_01770 [Flavobacteriaceae bacterium]|nr:hypothetical protein [Flavobacteriaceae bacterium]